MALLLLSACAPPLNVSTSTQPSISTSSQTAVSTEPSLTDNVYLENEPYSFSEVNPLFGPGPFSVNELAKIFGVPDFIGGYFSEEGGENGFFVLNARFENIMFDLAANNGEELNFIIKNDSVIGGYDKYEVTDSDKEVRMKPQVIGVWGGNWALPRKMNFGDSIEALYNAYNGNKGKEKVVEGRFMVSYDYGESGRITYEFDENIYTLEQVTIEWYNAWN